jgi:alpha-beta hydrolase superfamily lysophospholipase
MYNIWPSLLLHNGVNPEYNTHDLDIMRANLNDPLHHNRISARLGLDILNAGEWAIEHAGDFTLPLLMMHGGGDRVVSVDANREFAERVPGESVFKMWDGLYHELHNEPEHWEIFEYMIEWMGNHPA